MNIYELDFFCPVVALVQYHNSTCRVVRKSRFPCPKPDQPVGTTRGCIQHLSTKSRNYLAFVVSATSIKFCSIITLTYPEIFPKSGKIVKNHLNRFLTFLRRANAGLSYVWVVEFQARGAPHIHILTNVSPHTWQRKETAHAWASILNPYDYSDDQTRLTRRELFGRVYRVHSHRTAWDIIRLQDGARRYMVKYCLKTDQKAVPSDFSDIGRFFGWSRDVPQAIKPVGQIDLNSGELRLLLGALDHRVSKWHITPKYIFGLNCFT